MLGRTARSASRRAKSYFLTPVSRSTCNSGCSTWSLTKTGIRKRSAIASVEVTRTWPAARRSCPAISRSTPSAATSMLSHCLMMAWPAGVVSRPSGVSAQQLGAEMLLERRDSPRDRDVCDTELARRAGEGSIVGDREEDADVVPLPLASHRCSSLHTGMCAAKYRDCGDDLPCVVTEQKLCERPG